MRHAPLWCCKFTIFAALCQDGHIKALVTILIMIVIISDCEIIFDA